jgi:glycosyltransferase involved in cell wall biosynthesis
MRTVTVALPLCLHRGSFDKQRWTNLVTWLTGEDCVARIVIAGGSADDEAAIRAVAGPNSKVTCITVDSWISAGVMARLLDATDGDGLLFSPRAANLEFRGRGLRRLVEMAETTGAALMYSDYRQVTSSGARDFLLTQYQEGSIRESFDFGAAVWIAKQAAVRALRRHGRTASDVRWCAFYDLRLKLAMEGPIVHAEEALYFDTPAPVCTPDRDIRDYQLEAEAIATAHLCRLGAHVVSGSDPPPASREHFPVTASIVIPARNRDQTIGEAIQSALDQVAPFEYNILVVDDHSTDRTAEVVQSFARQHPKVIHLLPAWRHNSIGGLWNEAIYSPQCGRYAVQLDSDDVYAGRLAVERLVREFGSQGNGAQRPRYAMVVGCYKRVNATLGDIPGGLSLRPELSRENGRNNLLCIEGPGAPRAYYVPVLRQYGFPDVSFGEDYAVALRLARDYDIGRVLECLYLARQWDGNSCQRLPLSRVNPIDVDAIAPAGVDQKEFWRRIQPILSPLVMATVNRNQNYKDHLRTVEVQARRKRMSRKESCSVAPACIEGVPFPSPGRPTRWDG